MAVCELSGKKPVAKNLVSHSNIKTKSTSFPNVKSKSFYSPTLKRTLRFKVSTRALRTIDKWGGIDAYLMKCKPSSLSPKALNALKLLKKRHGEKIDHRWGSFAKK